MSKDAIISFRADSKLLNILREYCIKNKITVSGYFTILLKDILIDKKFVNRLENEIKLFVAKSKQKEVCSRLYITKNMYRRVMDMALSSYFTTGSVNMKSINTVIDLFVAQFETYDDSIKKDIQTEFKLTVKKLRSKEFLLGQSHNIKMLKYVSKK